MKRFLCAIGIHSGWHEVGRREPDALGIVTVYERCTCESHFREVWVDADDEQNFRVVRTGR